MLALHEHRLRRAVGDHPRRADRAVLGWGRSQYPTRSSARWTKPFNGPSSSWRLPSCPYPSGCGSSVAASSRTRGETVTRARVGRPAAEYSQAARVIELYDRLHRGETLHVGSLARELRLSPRTLQRDLAVLRESLGLALDEVDLRLCRTMNHQRAGADDLSPHASAGSPFQASGRPSSGGGTVSQCVRRSRSTLRRCAGVQCPIDRGGAMCSALQGWTSSAAKTRTTRSSLSPHSCHIEPSRPPTGAKTLGRTQPNR